MQIKIILTLTPFSIIYIIEFLILNCKMAGTGGFEPPNDDTKNRCLTTWRRPNNVQTLYQ